MTAKIKAGKKLAVTVPSGTALALPSACQKSVKVMTDLPKLSRPNSDDYYMGIAREVATKSSCYRRSVGAIIVKDGSIVATGYAGAPRKTADCFERGNCLRDKLAIPHGQRYELCRSVHAEQNAIINAARSGVSLLGGDMFIYGSLAIDINQPILAVPCFICKKMVINAGLVRVVCSRDFMDSELKLISFSVSRWAEEWKTREMTDDEFKYQG